MLRPKCDSIKRNLGELAPNQKAGDDNDGLDLKSPASSESGDVDVFSFEAEAGTEVYIDIDKTTHALDAVLELLDSMIEYWSGRPLLSRIGEDAALAVDSSMQDKAGCCIKPTHHLLVKITGQSTHATRNANSASRSAGTRNTYHVRVRSNTPRVSLIPCQ